MDAEPDSKISLQKGGQRYDNNSHIPIGSRWEGVPVFEIRAVVVGSSLSEVVGRGIYMAMNARLQAQAMALDTQVTYLDPEEGRRVALGNYQRAWELWRRKAIAK